MYNKYIYLYKYYIYNKYNIYEYNNASGAVMEPEVCEPTLRCITGSGSCTVALGMMWIFLWSYFCSRDTKNYGSLFLTNRLSPSSLSSCFLSLLLVAAVVWKVKQTCWASRRREVEHVCVCVCVCVRCIIFVFPCMSVWHICINLFTAYVEWRQAVCVCVCVRVCVCVCVRLTLLHTSCKMQVAHNKFKCVTLPPSPPPSSTPPSIVKGGLMSPVLKGERLTSVAVAINKAIPLN